MNCFIGYYAEVTRNVQSCGGIDRLGKTTSASLDNLTFDQLLALARAVIKDSVEDPRVAVSHSTLCESKKDVPKVLVFYLCNGLNHVAKNCRLQYRRGKSQIRCYQQTRPRIA